MMNILNRLETSAPTGGTARSAFTTTAGYLLAAPRLRATHPSCLDITSGSR
jgi:hypothetical protein